MSDKPAKIETHGDQSPGYVGGNFTVTKTIVQQCQQSRRKTWRPLDEIDYPAIVNDEDRRNKYTFQLALHLHRAFSNSGYTAFTGLVGLREAPMPDDADPIPVYCLVTHRSEFTGALRKTWKYLYNPNIATDDKEKLQADLNAQAGHLFKTWSVDLSLPFANRQVAVHFVYDPDSQRIYIGPPPHASTTPASYPDKLRTTSELFAFLSAIIGAPAVLLGDIKCITSYYPLFKVAIDLLDHRPLLRDRIRVNVNDCEEWDYINPIADEEVGRYSQEPGEP